MLQHVKKLFLAIIVITCFTCFQRADYNLPLFAFAYFLWEYKHPMVHIIFISVTKASPILPLCGHLDSRFHLGCVLGCHLEL